MRCFACANHFGKYFLFLATYNAMISLRIATASCRASDLVTAVVRDFATVQPYAGLAPGGARPGRSAISRGNLDTSAALRERPFPAPRQAES